MTCVTYTYSDDQTTKLIFYFVDFKSKLIKDIYNIEDIVTSTSTGKSLDSSCLGNCFSNPILRKHLEDLSADCPSD